MSTIPCGYQRPVLTKDDDGNIFIESESSCEFALYPQNIMMKALYHATCMMQTGSRRTIVYMNSQEECNKCIMTCFRKVIEDYHGVKDIWLGKSRPVNKQFCSVNFKVVTKAACGF